jgi:penicillin-binding protein 2
LSPTARELNREETRRRLFTRRALLLAAGQGSLFALLAGRLYVLQAVDAERYRTLAEDNRINLKLLAPPRGRILDRHGRPLAVNRRQYRVVVVAEQTADVGETLAALAHLVPIDNTQARRVLKDVRSQRAFQPVTVRDGLSWDDVARVEVSALTLPGIAIEDSLSREYVDDPSVSHVLGYVAAVSPDDPADDPLLRLPGFRIGKNGVEKVYDRVLRGTGGRSEVEVNALGRVIRELDRRDGQPGSDLRLSIDLDLQRLAFERLGEESGAAVLLDVHSGNVLALVSAPAFDPNGFVRGMSAATWKDLVKSEKSPLTNKALAGQYAPGSTFKPAVALAALAKGVMTPDEGVFCNGVTELGNSRFHCWKRGGHGWMNMQGAIAQSCDTYFYEAAKRTGIDDVSAMAHRLGLGEPTGIDLPGERTGVMPTRAWKRAALKSAWHPGETLIAGIGQGYCLSTPLQLAVMTARIANGTVAVAPRIALDEDLRAHAGTGPTGPFEALSIDPAHLRVVREGMDAVVNGNRGTARSSAIHTPGWEMAGKTGTSQVRRISRAERLTGVRRNEDLPWAERDHALFVGYAPAAAPRFAVAVIVEHGGGGSKAAAPIARDILIAAQEAAARDQVPPADDGIEALKGTPSATGAGDAG